MDAQCNDLYAMGGQTCPDNATSAGAAEGGGEALGAEISGKGKIGSERKLSLSQVAPLVDIDKSGLSRLSVKRPNFPWRTDGHGKRYLLLSEVAAWMKLYARRRRRRTDAGGYAGDSEPGERGNVPEGERGAAAGGNGGAVAAATAPVSSQAGSVEAVATATDPAGALVLPEALLAVLASESSTPVEISRATVRIMAFKVAKSGANFGSVQDLKKSMEELRAQETDFLEMQKARGELIERDSVRTIVTALVARLVRICERIENVLVGQIEVWMIDAEFAAMNSDDRRRAIRAKIKDLLNGVRRDEAEKVDAVVDRELTEVA